MLCIGEKDPPEHILDILTALNNWSTLNKMNAQVRMCFTFSNSQTLKWKSNTNSLYWKWGIMFLFVNHSEVIKNTRQKSMKKLTILSSWQGLRHFKKGRIPAKTPKSREDKLSQAQPVPADCLFLPSNLIPLGIISKIFKAFTVNNKQEGPRKFHLRHFLCHEDKRRLDKEITGLALILADGGPAFHNLCRALIVAESPGTVL